ncbi:MAG: helix-turn-helix domain-containing protein [Bacteroidota bacterium]
MISDTLHEVKACSGRYVLAINDTMNVLQGKWKLPILGCLMFGKKRFKEMEQHIPKITPRMLSKELKDLEMNGIVERKVHNTTPVTVEYQLTDAGVSFKKVLDVMVEWGLDNRTKMLQ